MTDTSPEAAARLDRLLRERSPIRRLTMATGMFETARALMIAGIRAEYGRVTDTELRRIILTRLYGDELSAGIIETVAAAGPRPWPPGAA